MSEYEVKCVTRESDPDYEDCRGIARIGVERFLASTKMKTPAQVYDLIDRGNTVVVEHNGEETEVQKAKHEGTKYVKTEPNDTKEDNLLKQESC